MPSNKILFVNNYDMQQSRMSYLNNESPDHHQFGTNYLINRGYHIDYELIVPKGYHNKICRFLSLIIPWIQLFFKARKFEIVYGAADFTIDFLGVLKKFRLFKPKVVTIMHHPPFPLRLSLAKYDKVIFLSEFAFNEMSVKFHKLRNRMEFIQWGPDLSFYDQLIEIPNYLKTNSELIFISNGKTHRDHESLVTAAESSKSHTIIVSNRFDIPKNYVDSSNYLEIFIQEYPNDKEMIRLLNKCSVLIIPTFPSIHRLGPIGLTSFLDAIALGMPVITASNTILTDIVTTYNLGFVYTAGDNLDLQRKMQLFKDNPELIKEQGENAYNFRKKCNSLDFSEKIHQILLNL